MLNVCACVCVYVCKNKNAICIFFLTNLLHIIVAIKGALQIQALRAKSPVSYELALICL